MSQKSKARLHCFKQLHAPLLVQYTPKELFFFFDGTKRAFLSARGHGKIILDSSTEISETKLWS